MVKHAVRALKKLFRRKLVMALCAVVVLGGGYGVIRAATQGGSDAPLYVTATVTRGMLTTSVSGSGQVAAETQVDIKPKVSGTVTYVGVESGDTVRAGTLLLKLDTADALKTLRDASSSLETAELSLDALLHPSQLSLLQARNSLASAQESARTAVANVAKGYTDAYNDVASTYLSVPTLVTNLHDILYGYNLDSRNMNTTALLGLGGFTDPYPYNQLVSKAETAYAAARAEYLTGLAQYQATSRDADHATVESLLAETSAVAEKLYEAARAEGNLINYWVDYQSGRGGAIPGAVSGFQTNLNAYATELNGDLVSLANAARTLADNAQAVVSAQRSVETAQLSLQNLQLPDELSVKQKQLSVEQAKNALADARAALADHYLSAPFTGIVAAVHAKAGDSVSSGSAVVTLVTEGNLAEISLNEVDVANVKVGDQAVVTFDAIDGLTLAGKVTEIDTLGTISQGVVTYGVKIAFDTQDSRVKPGMSLSASVITDSVQNALLLPNAAVKQQGDSWYVEVPAGSSTAGVQQVPVQAGLSNDTMTQIVSGLQEGDTVVAQTLSGSAAAQTSGSRNTGLGGASGGVFRVLR